MIRITIETVPEPTMIPRGPARREGDMLIPQAMLEPTIVYQQSWVDGTPQPDLQDLVAHLNSLQVHEPCATCGHEKALHVGGIGKCSDGSSPLYGNDQCRCDGYMTQQMKANRGAVIAAERAENRLEEATSMVLNLQNQMEGQALRIQNKDKALRLSKQSIEELEVKLKAARKRIRGLR